MSWAIMPETAIHEQCDPFFVENEIGFSEHGLVTPPTGDTVAAE